MLNGYKYLDNIGSGCFGLVDLYDKGGVNYVLKTQLLLPEEITIVDNKPKLNASRFNAEFSFARLVHLMPNNEAKYFMKLVSWDIAKNLKFDINKLCKLPEHALNDPNNNGINMQLRRLDFTKDVYYLRMIYPFVGNSAKYYIEEMTKRNQINYKYSQNLIKSLIEIVKITRKYKWYIRDLHWGNVCTDKLGNAILIDYGELNDMFCVTEQQKQYEFSINWDYWNIVKIAINAHYYFANALGEFVPEEDFMQKNFIAASKSAKWSTIKRYTVKFTNKSDIISECENGNYENVGQIIEFVDILWLIFDKKENTKFWAANWEFHHEVPFLLKQHDIIKLLNGLNNDFDPKDRYSGGSQRLIIHISGASGSGKTTLGNKLKDTYGNKIIVKDIDDLRSEFIDEFYGKKSWSIIDKNAYQKYIDNYINKIDIPLILVGLNNMPWWHKNLYYKLHSKYNFYIDLDDKIILKQKCTRYLTEIGDITKDDMAMNDMINNNNRFVKLSINRFNTECNMSDIAEINNKWKKDYKNQGYNIMTREMIYDEVCSILNKYI